SAGCPISTNPTSSAPQSRASCRSRAASTGAAVDWGPGWTLVVIGSPVFAYASIGAKNSLGMDRLDPPDGGVEQPQAVVTQQLPGLGLGLLPRRERPLHELSPLGGQAER